MNIPTSFLYISNIFNTLYLSNKGLVHIPTISYEKGARMTLKLERKVKMKYIPNAKFILNFVTFKKKKYLTKTGQN